MVFYIQIKGYYSCDASPVSPAAVAITPPLSTVSLFHHLVPLAAPEAPVITFGRACIGT
jgi:hypothetical protein